MEQLELISKREINLLNKIIKLQSQMLDNYSKNIVPTALMKITELEEQLNVQ